MNYCFADIVVHLKTPFTQYFKGLDGYRTSQEAIYHLEVMEASLTLPNDAAVVVKGREHIRLSETRRTVWYVSAQGEVLYCLDDDYMTRKAHLTLNVQCDETTKAEMAYVVSGLWFMDVAVREGRVPLHAGAIQSNQNTVAFMAPSGTGKSTLIRRILEHDGSASRLNDDKVFLTIKNNTLWLYSTPFSGEESLYRPFSGPLDTLVVLTQGRHNHLCLHPTEQWLHTLLKNTHRPWHHEAYHTLLKTLEQLMPLLTLWHYDATNDTTAATTLMTRLKEMHDAKN